MWRGPWAARSSDAVFDRGENVLVPLVSAIGHEKRGTRSVLVLRAKEVNKLADVLVAPITQGGDFARYAGLASP
jgi:mRNA interferase ChpB